VRGRGLENWTLVNLREVFLEAANQEMARALLKLLREQRRIQRALEKTCWRKSSSATRRNTC